MDNYTKRYIESWEASKGRAAYEKEKIALDIEFWNLEKEYEKEILNRAVAAGLGKPKETAEEAKDYDKTLAKVLRDFNAEYEKAAPRAKKKWELVVEKHSARNRENENAGIELVKRIRQKLLLIMDGEYGQKTFEEPKKIFGPAAKAKSPEQKNKYEEYKAAREQNYNLNIVKDLLEDEKLGQWTYEPLEAPKAFEAEASEEPKAPETQKAPEEPKAPEQKPQEPQKEPEESKEPEAPEQLEIPNTPSVYELWNTPEYKAREEQNKKEFEEFCKKLEERKAARKAEKAAQKRKEAEERKAAKKALKEAQKEQPAPQPQKPQEVKELEAPKPVKPVEAPKPKEPKSQVSPEALRAEAKKLREEAKKMLEQAESLELKAAEEEKRRKEIANLKNKIAEVEKIIEEAKANKAAWQQALKALEGGDEGSEGTETDEGFEAPEGNENPESTGFEGSEGDKSSGQSAQEAKASEALKPVELVNGCFAWEAERFAKAKKEKAKAARLARFEKIHETSNKKKLYAKLDKEYAEYCKFQEALFEFEEFANGTNLIDEKFEISEELENLCEAFENDELLNSPELKAPCSLSSAEDKVFEAPKPRAKSSVSFETDETFEAPKGPELKAPRAESFETDSIFNWPEIEHISGVDRTLAGWRIMSEQTCRGYEVISWWG